MDRPQPRLAVVIASNGRPEILRETLKSLLCQSRLPDEVVVSVASESDFPEPGWFAPIVTRVISPRGASVQRNRGIDSLRTSPLFVAFVDDDMVFHVDYLKNMEELFVKNDHLALVMGHLLVNGNVTAQQALELTSAPRALGKRRANTTRRMPRGVPCTAAICASGRPCSNGNDSTSGFLFIR